MGPAPATDMPSRPKAVLLDFYGTLVEGDGGRIERICAGIALAAGATPEKIHADWSAVFVDLWTRSWGDDFRLMREVVTASLQDVMDRHGVGGSAAEFCGELFAYWRRPAICPETRSVLAHCPVPVCIVSDVDDADIEAAMAYQGLSFDAVVTSQACRAYKPRPEMFDEALRVLGLGAGEVIHVGDSIRRDVGGALAVGIGALWINRGQPQGQPPPAGAREAPDLAGVLELFGLREAADEPVLIEPCQALGPALIEYVDEFRRSGERFWQNERGPIRDDVAGYIRRRHERARGVNVPPGLVPDSHFWLVRRERILGVARLRHELTDRLRVEGGHIGYDVRPSERGRGHATRLLALTLGKARQIGLARALVTCDKDNLASACVIRKNGGQLDSEGPSPDTGKVVQRYWIDL